ncbi:hypothetical protein DRO58_04355, partial [Candidatus Bathyarchaeota archaeon]
MRKPDFDRLLSVLFREESDVIPFYEHAVDPEVIETLTGKPVTRIPFGSDEFLKALVEFYYKLGYDYVPLEIPLNLPITNVRTVRD